MSRSIALKVNKDANGVIKGKTLEEMIGISLADLMPVNYDEAVSTIASHIIIEEAHMLPRLA